MFALSVIFALSATLLGVSAFQNETVGASCTITQFSQVSSVVNSCTNIIISNLNVPAGKTLQLYLKDGTTLTFQGLTIFGYAEWDGPLVLISGKSITVYGAAGSLLDGQGPLYWDGQGEWNNKKKPTFFSIERATGKSSFTGIKLLNCPMRCGTIDNSNSLVLNKWDIDCSAGASKGRNTDGFDVCRTSNLVIENTVIKNQDDCIVVNQGSNLRFTNIECVGSHGLSIAVGLSKTDSSQNTVSNVIFSDCIVKDGLFGIHIKTIPDGATGYIKDVTYNNIKMSGITYYGINIQQDYEDGHNTGNPKGNIKISGLTFTEVEGTLTGRNAMPVYILCGSGGCSNWKWSYVSVTGGAKKNSCNFSPSGYTC